MTDRSILVVGLPESGKTTFLAALWHLLNDATADVNLALDRLGDQNRRYLNTIYSEHWVVFEPVPRTPVSQEYPVDLLLRSRSDKLIRVSMPDVSGELFELYLDQREWPKAYDERVAMADGLVLFVHPDRPNGLTRIEDADEVLGLIDPPTEGDEGGGAEQTDEPVTLPTSVALVELLQLHLDRIARDQLKRISVIVSAWDLVADEGLDPGRWLEREMPALAMFLETHQDLFDFKVFGVSAQGGDYGRDGVALRQHLRPADRILVVVGASRSHDITAPVDWVSDGGPDLDPTS